MSLKSTLWKPSTCACQVRIDVDPNLPEFGETHTLIAPCSEHADLTLDTAGGDAIVAENQLVNQVEAALRDAHPDITGDGFLATQDPAVQQTFGLLSTWAGGAVPRYAPGVAFAFQHVGKNQRTLVVDLSALGDAVTPDSAAKAIQGLKDITAATPALKFTPDHVDAIQVADAKGVVQGVVQLAAAAAMSDALAKP